MRQLIIQGLKEGLRRDLGTDETLTTLARTLKGREVAAPLCCHVENLRHLPRG